ncbi:MAG: response regulator transcription factor [Acetivibrio sp.]
MRILMVEDDEELCKITGKQIQKAGYEVDSAYDGEEALLYIEVGMYDIILLDRMLPQIDGLTVLSTIRKKGITTPVILLTALNEIHDRVDGLDAGADDYLVKPYEIEELFARIRALLRRPGKLMERNLLTFEDLILQEEGATLMCGSESRVLSKKETRLMEFFMQNGNQILSREQILSKVWGTDSFVEDGNIDNYIYFLRRKLKALSTQVGIVTIHGVGYRLERVKGPR